MLLPRHTFQIDDRRPLLSPLLMMWIQKSMEDPFESWLLSVNTTMQFSGVSCSWDSSLFQPDGSLDHIDVDDLLLVTYARRKVVKSGSFFRANRGDFSWLYYHRAHTGGLSQRLDIKIASTIATHIWREEDGSLPKPAFDKMIRAVGNTGQIIEIRDKIMAFFRAADLTLPDTGFNRQLFRLQTRARASNASGRSPRSASRH